MRFTDTNAIFLQRKPISDKQTTPKPRNPPKPPSNAQLFAEVNDPSLMTYGDDVIRDVDPQQKPKRLKRPKKSVNENIEPAFDAPIAMVPDLAEYPLQYNNFSTFDFQEAVEREVPPDSHPPT